MVMSHKCDHLLFLVEIRNIYVRQTGSGINFWETVCKTVRPMLSDRCLSCPVLSVVPVTFLYRGQTVGWINMKLGVQVGLGPDHIVLYGDPVPRPKGAHPPIFDPYLLWPNGWMAQDANW